VTRDDIRAEVRRRLGFAPDEEGAAPAPEAEGAAGAEPTATPDAGEAPEPVATVDPAEVTREYQNFLRRAGLRAAQYERILEAQIILERLERHFDEGLEEAGPQVELARIRVGDFALAEVIRQEVLDGGDFAELARTHSIDERAEEGGELGWRANELLTAGVADAVRELDPGEVSEVVPSGATYELYLVQAREEAREYDPLTRLGLVSRRLGEWFEREQEALDIRLRLSDRQVDWINQRALERIREVATRLAENPG
jgi:hypothetical protein